MCRSQCVLALVALCVGLAQTWDFAITAGDRLEFYTNNGNKTDTVRFVSQNLTALAYNEVHDILFYIDKQTDNDAICGYNISSEEYKCYIERNGRNIQGLAFDPITEILFFTDSKESTINWISFKPGTENSVRENILINTGEGIPTDIAVDSCRGYIYWINTKLTPSTIERARFNGFDREIVIKASYNEDLHSLAIDQQTQKIYWFTPETSSKRILYSADLKGKNKKSLLDFIVYPSDKTITHPNTLTISKEYLFVVSWCISCNQKSLWKLSKTEIETASNDRILKIEQTRVVGIAAKYKINDQILGVQECKAVTSLVPNNYEINNSYKIAREYVGPFCDHGIKVNGLSLCKCTPGYTGKRCDVSVCENYCLQGDCSFNEEGVPECRCNAGYSGDRCDVNLCHGYCLKNGTCSLNEENEPVCECIGDYTGARCEVSDCLNYCLQGDCSFNEEGVPECRCNAGYSGERCDINLCHGYCLKNGTCSLNEENEPVCECIGDYTGARCEVSDCLNYCLQGDCSFNEEGVPECRCNAGYSGERCDVNVCLGYCLNNGTCSMNEEDEPVCECIGDYTGDRCDIPACLNNGDCSINGEGSRCKADKNNTISTIRNLTLADLFANWRNPVTKIVIVEVKSN